MSQTISQVAKLMNLPVSTIRYYDKEGLLPFVKRKESGYREFSDGDVEMLRLIDCLKRTGMPIKDIRQFSEWVKQGNGTVIQRYELFLNQRKIIEQQIKELNASLEVINHKCDYYKKAVEESIEDIHSNQINKSQKI